MGLQTLKCFIYGDVAKHHQTGKETSLRSWQTIISACHAILFLSSNCHDISRYTDSVLGKNFLQDFDFD